MQSLVFICTVAMAIPSFTGLIIYRIVAGFIGSSCIHTLTTAVLVRWYSKRIILQNRPCCAFLVYWAFLVSSLSAGAELPKFGIGHWYIIAGGYRHSGNLYFPHWFWFAINPKISVKNLMAMIPQNTNNKLKDDESP